MKQFHKFGLVMGANFETVGAMIAAFYSAKWLNTNYPKDFDWANVTYIIGLLLIARSWYSMLRVLIRDQKASETVSDKSESKNDFGTN